MQNADHLTPRVAQPTMPNRHKGRAQVSGLLGCAILVRNALSFAASIDAINNSLQMQNADHLTPRVMQPTMPNRHKGRTHGKFQKHGLNFAQWEFAHCYCSNCGFQFILYSCELASLPKKASPTVQSTLQQFAYIPTADPLLLLLLLLCKTSDMWTNYFLLRIPA